MSFRSFFHKIGFPWFFFCVYQTLETIAIGSSSFIYLFWSNLVYLDFDVLIFGLLKRILTGFFFLGVIHQTFETTDV
jgi:hypothetical protein